MLHATSRIIVIVAAALLLAGCSCNALGRWAQDEIGRTDEALAGGAAIVRHIGSEATRLVPYTGAAASDAMRYTGTEIDRLHGTLCCQP